MLINTKVTANPRNREEEKDGKREVQKEKNM
jgi:hypothetical protein